MDIPRCAHCQGRNVKIRRRLTSNGHSQNGWRCLDCDRWAKRDHAFESHAEVDRILERYGKTMDDIVVIADNTGFGPCVICDAPGAYHHWWPKKYRDLCPDDWWAWPGTYLCDKHHMEWHQVLTPDIYRSAKDRDNG